MAYYKTMTPQALKAAHHEAKIGWTTNRETARAAVRAGLHAKDLRSAQVAAYWHSKLKTIEAVARSRGIDL